MCTRSGVLKCSVLLVMLLFGACPKQYKSGPVEVKWDRDTCNHCSMVLSDRNFAAQVRGGPQNKIYKFDDIGCAILWRATQPWGLEETTRIWVASYADGNWLNARTAHYEGGKTSPMGFNFAAMPSHFKGMTFSEVMRKVSSLKKRLHP